MPWAMAAAAAAPIIGGAIGQLASQDDRDAAEKAMQEAQQIIDSVGAPPDLSQQIILEKFKQAGVLTPQLEQAVSIGTSKMAELQEQSPEAKQAQISALQTLAQTGRAGLRAEDRAALAQIRDQTQRDVEAKRQQMIQNMQARGQAGSGAELAASLAASQEGAQRASEQGLQVGAQAQSNALAALAQSGALGNQLRSQDISFGSNKANAADAFRQFDVQNQVAQQQRNIAAQNTAQQYNISNLQNISNQNVEASNAEKYRQAQAKQDFWNNQLKLAQAKAGARSNAQQYYSNQAASTAGAWAGMGAGAGQGAASYGSYANKKADS